MPESQWIAKFFDKGDSSLECSPLGSVEWGSDRLVVCVFAPAPVDGIDVAGKVHQQRSPRDKRSFGWHLHLVAAEEVEHVEVWQVAVKVVEERRNVMVVTIVPSPSATGGSDPKRDASVSALFSYSSRFSGSWLPPVDDDSESLPFGGYVLGCVQYLLHEFDPAGVA